MYKFGLFDKRFVYSDDDEIKTPFVIDYSEEESA